MRSRTSFALLGVLASVKAQYAGTGTWPNITVPREYPTQNTYPPNGPQLEAHPPLNDSYEYIVVGSGPGGAPLAARLALAGYSVLLVDAGADHGHMREVEVPVLSVWASERNEVAWDFFTHHYENETQALRDRHYTYLTTEGDYYTGSDPPEGAEPLGNWYPRVGGLGGCAQHNAMLAILPNARDWDLIKNLTGDDNWDAAKMRGYYKKLEKNGYILPNADLSAHGYDGWLATGETPLTLVAQDLKILSLVLGACQSLGINTDGVLGQVLNLTDSLVSGLLPIGGSLLGLVENLGNLLLTDINNDEPGRDGRTSLSQIPLSMNVPDYSRSSPRDWIYEIVNEKNADGSKKYKLDVALNTLVTKVMFDTESSEKPRATGVEYLYGEAIYRADKRASLTEETGTPGSVKATREVIVSGGAYNTPQILKLSGVGPADELAEFNIPLIKDLPGVGTNLQDRYEVGLSGAADTQISLLTPCTFLVGDNDPCYDQWESGIGPLKGAYTTNGIALGLFTKSSVAETDDHDLWVGGIPALFQGYFPGYTFTAEATKTVWTWLVLKARSHNNAGTVKLASADPRDTPRITFHSFHEGSDPEGADRDLQAVLEGMRWGQTIFQNMIPLDGNFTQVWPPPEISSDDEMKQWIQDEAWGHHASCSCPIGADDDPMAVLDGQFRVRGVEGLRVVDASVFPKIPGTFIALPIYMLSEKAADDILADAA